MIVSTGTVGFRGGDAIVNGVVGFSFPAANQVPNLVPFFITDAQQRGYLDSTQLEQFLQQVQDLPFSQLVQYRELALETVLAVLAQPTTTRQATQRTQGKNYGS